MPTSASANPTPTGCLFTFYTLTPLHAGSGESSAAVDLAIQREKHTEYPCVFASSLKGSLRWFCQCKGIPSADVEKIFGKEGDESGSGQIAFTDARLLLFPVRSSVGVFKWITSPFVLRRLARDLKFISASGNLPDVQENVDIATPADAEAYVIEDFLVKIKSDSIGNKMLSVLQNLVPQTNELRNRLLIVSDDMFKTLVTTATQVIARNILDDETKTSKNLWYEEVVPADAVFYAIMKTVYRAAAGQSVLETMVKAIGNEIIQIGGNETVGHGFVQMSSDLARSLPATPSITQQEEQHATAE